MESRKMNKKEEKWNQDPKETQKKFLMNNQWINYWDQKNKWLTVKQKHKHGNCSRTMKRSNNK